MVVLIQCLVGSPDIAGSYLRDRPMYGQIIRWTKDRELAHRYQSVKSAEEDVLFAWGRNSKLVRIMKHAYPVHTLHKNDRNRTCTE